MVIGNNYFYFIHYIPLRRSIKHIKEAFKKKSPFITGINTYSAQILVSSSYRVTGLISAQK
jgi:hypothetical protein